MSQYANAFAVGRVRALENKLLTPDRVQRMLDATSAEEALRYLSEVGYGQGSDKADDFEALIAYELKRTVELMGEISPQPELTDLFFLQYDVHNIKTLYKARFSGDKVTSVLSPMGRIDTEKLSTAIMQKEYRDLPGAIITALERADQKMRDSIDPGILDACLDQAYYQCIVDKLAESKSVSGFASDYFALSADFNNIILALRLKAMAKPVELFHELFLPCGTLAIEALEPILTQEQPVIFFSASRFASTLDAVWQNYRSSGSIVGVEKDRDNTLFKRAGLVEQSAVSIGPVLRYLLAREQEAKVVRLIMTGKVNNISDTLLKERVRELSA